jgi:hypothetical protein
MGINLNGLTSMIAGLGLGCVLMVGYALNGSVAL